MRSLNCRVVLFGTTLGLQPRCVLRYRISLEQKQYAPSTINLRLAAARRGAYEAADSGLLSPELAKLAPDDLRRACARLCHLAGGELDQIQFLLGDASIQTTERYLGCKQKLRLP